MNEDYAKDIARRTHVDPEICKVLLQQGWKFVIPEHGPAMWVSPGADDPNLGFIEHKEPNCDSTCGNLAPHRHGLPCHKNCALCAGVCHPECPAYVVKEE